MFCAPVPAKGSAPRHFIGVLLRENATTLFVFTLLAAGQQNHGQDRECPTWNAAERELRFGGRVIKRFKWHVENQERILNSFQEEGWPHRIDDPIPPKPDHNQRQRLRDAISSLNKHLECTLIRFRSDASGLGVIWELVQSAPDRQGKR